MSLYNLLPVLAVLLGLAATLPAQGEADAPVYGLQCMARFDQLPALKEAVCRQVSSYDRGGRNRDAGHFLNGYVGRLPNNGPIVRQLPGNLAVLADLKGPGCIYRIWSANPAGFVRFYFDGEATPRIACPMQDLFLNRYPPFQSPLAGQSSGGFYSYFPIPFAQSVRVEVDNPNSMYYQIQYHELPQGTPVRTFTRELPPEDRAALETVLDHWNNPGQAPHPMPEASAIKGDYRSLKGGQKATLLDQQGGGTIRSLRLWVAPATPAALRGLVLRAYWDGATAPAIDAPVGDFFGAGGGERSFRSLPLAVQENSFFCYFPMPFRKSARVEVANEGGDLIQVSWEVQVGEGPEEPEETGIFHARWRRVKTERDRHVSLLETEGRGHYIGVNLTMQGKRGLWFLEGDEKIYVDGEAVPSIYGTGTEDYFTAAWYFQKGPFSLPYHGCLVKDGPRDRIAAYRYQITDCIPFKKSIRIRLEHGGWNNYPDAEYSFTTFWYQAGG
jgi:D-arabinan exo alpha-(1,3)/(1,5)-arabinofuranosidase (non-reducing end)